MCHFYPFILSICVLSFLLLLFVVVQNEEKEKHFIDSKYKQNNVQHNGGNILIWFVDGINLLH